MSDTTHITKVAIVGATGRIGKAFADALLATGKHTVTALTRPDSKGTVPSGAKTVKVNYDDEDAMISALKGQQILIVTLGVTAPRDLHAKIVQAGGKAGVPYIMPNIYGNDMQNERLRTESPFPLVETYIEYQNDVKKSGSSFIVLCCGVWYEWSLALFEPWFGFTIAERKVTFYDDGKTKINTSTWDQCGRAVAALLSLPISGASPCVDDWKNQCVYMDSFCVSQRDMLDSLHRVLRTSDADWTISYEASDKRMKRGLEELQAGNQMGFPTAMYARAFFPNGDGNFGARWGLANEALSLPKEDLDEVTKRTVGMVEDGWAQKVLGSMG